MTKEMCPNCGASLIEDASENLVERQDGTVEIDAYLALVCEAGCGHAEPIKEFPRIIGQQDDDRLLLLYPNEQGRILDLCDGVLHPSIHYLSILGRGYWEEYKGKHDVQSLLEEVYDSEAPDNEPPSLFKFGTSELSQDAFLCWLLSWGKKKYYLTEQALHNVAVEFVSAIFAAHGHTMPEIRSIKVRQQVKLLDILVIVNNQYAILIEDKTFTKNHSDQLCRYRKAIKEEFPSLTQLPIYFKIADQSHFRSVEAAGYKPFTRKMMLEVLDKGKDINNAIFLDYYRHLQRLDEKFSSFWVTPVSKWSAFAWQGFYQELQKEIGGDWGYVSNPRGGFWGFWWGRDRNNKYYFQLEQDRLCVKVVADEDDDKRKLRNDTMKEILLKSDEEGLSLRRPARVMSGRTMTVAEKHDYMVTNEAGLVDIKLTIAGLKKF